MTVATALDRQKQQEPPVVGINNQFTPTELEWFSKNSYNLALKNTTSWDLRYVVRMLSACVRIMDHLPSTSASATEPPNQVDLTLRALFARFIIACSLVSLARTQDNVEAQLRDYRALRDHVAAFDACLTPGFLAQLADGKSREDMRRKQAALLAFDFEAVTALGEWDELGGVVRRAGGCGDVVAYQAMADVLLRGRVPGEGTIFFLPLFLSLGWKEECEDGMELVCCCG